MRLFAGTPFDRPPVCERCGRSADDCTCQPGLPPPGAAGMPIARLAVEKRNKGKLVTIVRGPPLGDLPALLTQLKSACGAGGTLKEDAIEIQGDHVRRIGEALAKLGYRTRN
jgi:translation initiation factor 1